MSTPHFLVHASQARASQIFRLRHGSTDGRPRLDLLATVDLEEHRASDLAQELNAAVSQTRSPDLGRWAEGLSATAHATLDRAATSLDVPIMGEASFRFPLINRPVFDDIEEAVEWALSAQELLLFPVIRNAAVEGELMWAVAIHAGDLTLANADWEKTIDILSSARTATRRLVEETDLLQNLTPSAWPPTAVRAFPIALNERGDEDEDATTHWVVETLEEPLGRLP